MDRIELLFFLGVPHLDHFIMAFLSIGQDLLILLDALASVGTGVLGCLALDGGPTLLICNDVFERLPLELQFVGRLFCRLRRRSLGFLAILDPLRKDLLGCRLFARDLGVNLCRFIASRRRLVRVA